MRVYIGVPLFWETTIWFSDRKVHESPVADEKRACASLHGQLL